MCMTEFKLYNYNFLYYFYYFVIDRRLNENNNRL